MKNSSGKASWPGAKQVFRQFDGDGLARKDIIAGLNEQIDGSPLLATVVENGALLPGYPGSLDEQVARARDSVAALPPAFRELEPAEGFEVEFTEYLKHLQAETLKKVST